MAENQGAETGERRKCVTCNMCEAVVGKIPAMMVEKVWYGMHAISLQGGEVPARCKCGRVDVRQRIERQVSAVQLQPEAKRKTGSKQYLKSVRGCEHVGVNIGEVVSGKVSIQT